MRYSKLFGKTKFTAPHDADSVNAKYLTQGGFIDQQAAGIYHFLPLGMRVLQKINQIIREEMNTVGGQELLMPVLHPLSLWETTGRTETMDEILYRTQGASDQDFVLGPSHEETVTPLAKKFIQSYKDLPLAVYQLQTKFRNEPRAKSGILRGREFGMKDMYSFHRDEADLDRYYEEVKEAYLKIYERLGLEAYVVEASGGAFTDKFSHEFSVVTVAGEDTILLCKKCKIAQNIEIAKQKKLNCPKCGQPLEEQKAIEAGNIFKLGTKFSKDFDLTFTDENGERKLTVMGCYGIGTTRLVGTIVEASHDEKGIIWPKSVAPYEVHLISLGKSDEVRKQAEKLYQELLSESVEVLFDDRDETAGKKFNDADLIGIPLRIVISERTLKEQSVEMKMRHEKEGKLIKLEQIFKEILY
jgi:prolyl-tRNA synthetase